MRLNSIRGKIVQLRRVNPFRWGTFTKGWLARRKNQVVPCILPGCDQFLQVPLRDFYESYYFFSEESVGILELEYFLDRVRPGEVFYDIGAYRGAYLAALKLRLQGNASVHVFDPIRGNIEAIRKICRLNGFDQVKINQQAVGLGKALVGNICGEDFMFRAVENPTITGKTEFTTVSLDDYIASGAPPPSLVKMDVEGFDLEVLQGASKVLSQHRPRLWLEIHPNFLEAQGKSADTVLALLREIGYKIVFFSDYYSPDTKIAHHIWCE